MSRSRSSISLPLISNLNLSDDESDVEEILSDDGISGFTGNMNVDIGILSILDDASLNSICSTNRYLRSLCFDEELWRRRMVQFYPDAIRFKDPDESWYDYYNIINGLTLNTEGANWAAENGYLSALKYLASLDPPIHVDEVGLYEITEYSTPELLDWILTTSPNLKLNNDVLEIAIEVGNYDIFEWVMENKTDPRLYDPEVVWRLTDQDDQDDDEFQFREDSKYLYYDSEKLAIAAIKYGRLNMLISILDKYPFIVLDRNGNILRLEGEYDHDISSLIDEVVKSGHVDIIDWSFYNLLDNYKYIHPNWNKKFFITKLVINATEKGRLHILDWIVELTKREGDVGTLDQRIHGVVTYAAYDNRPEVIIWALEAHPDFDFNRTLRRRLIETARRLGNIQVIDFLSSYSSD